jgi:Fic family protein
VLAPRSGSLDEKVEYLRTLQSKTDPTALKDYNYRLDISWIHHDGALEGVVYDPRDLRLAIEGEVVSDRSLIPVYDEIRNYKAALDLIREMADKKRRKITLDTIKKIYLALAPEEAETKGPPKYRKEMPLHRVYFHEISVPKQIGYRMRQLILWMSSEETRRFVHPVRLAARAHTTLIHIFPFQKHSGKVARLLMNLILLQEGYPPVIVHSTERQRYYESIRISDDAVSNLIHDSLENSVDSALRFFMKLHGIEEQTEQK